MRARFSATRAIQLYPKKEQRSSPTNNTSTSGRRTKPRVFCPVDVRVLSKRRGLYDAASR